MKSFSLLLVMIASQAWAASSDFSINGLHCPGGYQHFGADPTCAPGTFELISDFTTNGAYGQPIPLSNLIEHRNDAYSPGVASINVRYPDICHFHTNFPAAIWTLAGTNSAGDPYSVSLTNFIPPGMCQRAWTCFPDAGLGGSPNLQMLAFEAHGPMYESPFDRMENFTPQIDIQLPTTSPPWTPWPTGPSASGLFATATMPGVTLMVYSSTNVAGNDWTYEETLTTDAFGFAEAGTLPTPPDMMFYKIVCYTNSP